MQTFRLGEPSNGRKPANCIMRPMRRSFLAILALLTIVAAACGEGGSAGTTPSPLASPVRTAERALPVIELTLEAGTLRVEVADTPEARAQGLSNRDALPQEAGMLFDLGENRVPGFWMKEMRIPLDMIWIDENKTVVAVTIDVQPEPGVADAQLRRYSPPEPVRYVLEVNAGASLRLGIEAGDVLLFDLP